MAPTADAARGGFTPLRWAVAEAGLAGWLRMDQVEKDISCQIVRFGLSIRCRVPTAEQQARAKIIAAALLDNSLILPQARWKKLAGRFIAAFGAPAHKIPVWQWAAHLADIDPLYREPLPASRRCDAEPGSEAKLQAMEDRCAAGLSIHHQHDCQQDPDTRGARFLPNADTPKGNSRNGATAAKTRQTAKLIDIATDMPTQGGAV